MRNLSLIVIALAALTTGCGQSHPGVTHIADDDTHMTSAIATARSSANDFVTALQSPKPEQSQFKVKVPFTDGKQIEHLWLAPVSYDGQNFRGTVSNDPELLKNVKRGQEVTVEPAKISDWMYVENKKLVGGYTIRALRESTPSNERGEFDKKFSFVVE